MISFEDMLKLKEMKIEEEVIEIEDKIDKILKGSYNYTSNINIFYGKNISQIRDMINYLTIHFYISTSYNDLYLEESINKIIEKYNEFGWDVEFSIDEKHGSHNVKINPNIWKIYEFFNEKKLEEENSFLELDL